MEVRFLPSPPLQVHMDRAAPSFVDHQIADDGCSSESLMSPEARVMAQLRGAEERDRIDNREHHPGSLLSTHVRSLSFCPKTFYPDIVRRGPVGGRVTTPARYIVF